MKMLNTTTTTIGTAAVVGVSLILQDPKKRKSDAVARQIIGLALVALFLAGINEVNSDIAEGFGALIFLSALYLYGPQIVTGLRLGKVRSF